MNKEEILKELEILANKSEGVRVIEDYHRGILDSINIVKKLDYDSFHLSLNRFEKCGRDRCEKC
jgi:hypothetical protein